MSGSVDLGATPRWADPVPAILLGTDPVNHLVPYWRKLLMLVYPFRDDSLVARDWKAAVALVDGEPLPTTVEGWNLRWRQFVVAVWRLVVAHERRLAVQAASARWAVLTPGRRE